MSDWLILPVLVPLLTGALLVVLHGRSPGLQAGLGLTSLLAQGVLAGLVVLETASGQILVSLMGNWQAPFGIALAADRLTAIMLGLTFVVALASLLASLDGTAARGAHFHALFQIQLAGLNGAYLTADVFNLFVFFEVLLIASYALLLHGGGRDRLVSATHYVVVNLAASALFLFGVGVMYGITGTLNMADLAARTNLLTGSEADLVLAGGLLLLVVFAVKAALVPLYFWLPSAYSAAGIPVAALFVIMTKVGVYALARVWTLILAGTPLNTGPAADVLVAVALATLALASVATLAARELRRMTAYLVMASAGLIVAGITIGNPASIGASLYYLMHTTVGAAALFLVAQLIGAQRHVADVLVPSGPMVRAGLTGVLFILVAMTVAGFPPFSGFIGKAVLLAATVDSFWAPALWTVVLAGGLVTVMALARAGSLLFWTPASVAGPLPPAAGTTAGTLWGIVLLLTCGALLMIFPVVLQDYTRAAGEQLSAPHTYIRAVLAQTPTGAATGGSE